MKSILILLLASTTPLFAQWSGTSPIYYNSGSVGIGISTPAYKLTVAGGDIKAFAFDNHTGIMIGAEQTERPRIGFHVSDNNRRFKIEFNGANTSTERLGIFTNAGGAWGETEVFSISKIGRVGIGTTAPEVPLHVKGKIMSTHPSYSQINARLDGEGDYPALRLTRWTGGTGSIQDNAYIGQYAQPDGRYGLSIGVGASSTGDQNYTAPVITIPLTGNVGVGTSTPPYKLTVAGGDIKAFAYDNNTGIMIGAEQTERPRVGFHVSDNDRRFKIEFNGANTAAERLGIFTNAGGASGETEVFSISKAGLVGIGTTTPDAKLAVNGTIHTKEVRVDMIGWPDYVFDQNYKLLPLDQLQEYIRVHNRLPGIPSANEVQTNGSNLGEMNKVLVEKIEELTLYVLELKAKNDELESRMNSLEKK